MVKAKAKSPLGLSGKTTDDHPVVFGVGQLTTTYGLPLEVALQYLKSRDLICDWMDYIGSSLRDGAKPKNVKVRIMTAVSDVYGKKYAAEIQSRLDSVLPDEPKKEVKP